MSLPVVAEMLSRSMAEDCEFIEKAHVVESVIDVIKLKGNLPVEWKHKLPDSQGTVIFHIFPSTVYSLLNCIRRSNITTGCFIKKQPLYFWL